MKENQKKAFDFAADTTKQLITISTAIITLTVSFSKDILSGTTESTKTFLIWTWGVFVGSIILGLATLMALTGRLLPIKKTTSTQPNATGVNNNIVGSAPTPTQAQNLNPQTNVTPDDDDIHINHWNIRVFSMLQIALFSIAIMMTGIFGYKILNGNNVKHKNTYIVIRKATLNNDTTKYIDTIYLDKGNR